MKTHGRLVVLLLVLGLVGGTSSVTHGYTILGTGTGALLGNDLTDLGNNGVEVNYSPPNLGGFDAVFFSSDKPYFDGGEGAFNMFDNLAGGGNNKWCCGTTFPEIIGAQFDQAYLLTHFTVTSSNDTPERDPRVWTVEGSNDGTNWTPIFSQNNANAALWTARDQVIRFDEGVDYPVQTAGYESFRMVTTATGLTGGAFFAISELELFGRPAPQGEIPEPATMALLGLAACGLGGYLRRRRRA